jgi:hypothetical protein
VGEAARAAGEGATVDGAARDVELTMRVDAVGGLEPEGDADAVGAADGGVLGRRPSRFDSSSVAGGPDRDADGWTAMARSSSPPAIGATQAAIEASPARTATTATVTITRVPIAEGAEPSGGTSV